MPDNAERAAVRVGVLTTAIGGVLAAAPGRVGPLMEIPTDPRVAGGLWVGLNLRSGSRPPPRPTSMALARRPCRLLNLTIVGYAVVIAGHNRRTCRVAAVALVAATVSDLDAMSALRSSGR